jgi:hypothetical protein
MGLNKMLAWFGMGRRVPAGRGPRNQAGDQEHEIVEAHSGMGTNCASTWRFENWGLRMPITNQVAVPNPKLSFSLIPRTSRSF